MGLHDLNGLNNFRVPVGMSSSFYARRRNRPITSPHLPIPCMFRVLEFQGVTKVARKLRPTGGVEVPFHILSLVSGSLIRLMCTRKQSDRLEPWEAISYIGKKGPFMKMLTQAQGDIGVF